MERAPKTSGKALSWMGRRVTPTMMSLREWRGGDEWSHGAAAGCGGEDGLGAAQFWSARRVVDGGINIDVGA